MEFGPNPIVIELRPPIFGSLELVCGSSNHTITIDIASNSEEVGSNIHGVGRFVVVQAQVFDVPAIDFALISHPLGLGNITGLAVEVEHPDHVLIRQGEIIFNVSSKVDHVGKGRCLNHARPKQTENHNVTHRAYHDKSPYSSRRNDLKSVSPSLIQSFRHSLSKLDFPIFTEHTHLSRFVQEGNDPNLFPLGSCLGVSSEYFARSGSFQNFPYLKG